MNGNRFTKIILSYIAVVLLITLILWGYRTWSSHAEGGKLPGDDTGETMVAGDEYTMDDGKTTITLTNIGVALKNSDQVERYYKELIDTGIITEYDYVPGDDHIKLTVGEGGLDAFCEYYRKVIADAAAFEYDKYSFSVSEDYGTLELKAHSDADNMAAFRDMGRLLFDIENYQISSGRDAFKCCMVVTNVDTGKELCRADVPGGKINVSAQDWTGIEDQEEAQRVFSSNGYSYINYDFPEAQGDKYICKAAGFSFDLPEDAKLITQDVLNEANKVQDPDNVFYVKMNLDNEKPYIEFEVYFDEDTYVVFTVLYSEAYNESNFAKLVTANYERMSVEKTSLTTEEFLGQEAVWASYSNTEKSAKAINFYRNGLAFSFQGYYKNESKAQLIDDFYKSIKNT